MKVYILKEEPRTCLNCIMCNEDGYCLACDSKYMHYRDNIPYWCMIEHENGSTTKTSLTEYKA